MPLSAGDKLDHYEVVSLLGQGGMGEVFRARDTTLKRDVALKVLSAAFLSDHERMARFQREAEVLASLDHPNIGHIHGIVDFGDSRALVLALIEGPTLADRLVPGPLPLDEAITISKQIVEALEYAHERGVVHRDLKPANVKMTSDGVVKVLDFGLAKVLEEEAPASSLGNSPTLTMGHTRAGMILGTAAYMSPEQAVGREVDRRSDIFSFGAVLYEMLTGKRAFSGTATPDVLEAVVKNDPDWSALPAGTPKYLRTLLERTLTKDRKQRLQAIGEARITLANSQDNGSSSASTAPTASSMKRFRMLAPIAAAVFFVTTLALAFLLFRASPPLELAARFEVTVPDRTSRGVFELSPDGRFLAISGNAEVPIYIRPIDSLEARPLPGTEGGRYPIWSPDSAYLAFFAQGKLKKIALTGGSPQVLCDVPDPHGGSWSDGGVILFSPSARSGLLRVSAAGGVPVPVTTLGNAGDSHRYPVFLPGGHRFLYLLTTDKPETSGIHAGSLDNAPSIRLLPDPSSVDYAPASAAGQTGHLLFLRGRALMAQPFDPDALKMKGEMLPVAQDVTQSGNTGHGAFSVASNGTLAYNSGPASGGAGGDMVWMDRAGKTVGTVMSPSGRVSQFSLSPDGRRIAAIIRVDAGSSDVWMGDADRGILSRFTFGPATALGPVWSPDGSRIAYTTRDPNVSQYEIFQKPVTGNGQAQRLLQTAAANVFPYDWSPDGRFLAYAQDVDQTKRDLWLLPIEGDHKPVLYLQTPYNETNPQFSPDGKQMAYSSDETGQSQVYVQAIPATGAKFQISTAGGAMPRWRHDGKELFYIATDQKLMAVPVNSKPAFETGTPLALFDTSFEPTPGTVVTPYQPSSDGQRFLMLLRPENKAAPPISLVLHWESGIKR